MKPIFLAAGKIPRGQLLLLGLLLFGLTLGCFLPSLRGGFIDVDDGVFVCRNPHIDLTPANVVWAFGHTECSNWLPLTVWSFMVDHQLYGFNPWGFHLTNVLLHAINTALVFLVLRRMTGATWRSLAVASLFGLHPLRVESVAWISERKDVLSLMFWLLTLWAYTRYAQSVTRPPGAGASASIEPRVTRRPSFFYGLALALFALDLMSKPMVVTLPFVLLLLDYWPLDRWKQNSLRSLLVEKVPFLLLSTFVCMITYVAQKNAGMMSAALTGLSLSFGARLENALVSYVRYLGKLFWPVDLCALYPYPDHWPMPKVLLAGLMIAALSVLAFVLRRRFPCFLTGWLWYLGTLAPVLGLVSVGAQAMADRYTYIPSLGILMVVVWGACQLTERWRYQGIGLGAGGGALVLVCLALTRHQLGYWKDGISVWQRAVTVTENNYQAHNWLGCALYSVGQFDGAIPEFQTVVRLNPSFAEADCALGRSLEAVGRPAEAMLWYQKALKIDPNYVTAHNNVAILLLQKGRADEAMVHAQKALASEPDNVMAHDNLGLALALNGHFDEALAHFQLAVTLQPDNETAQFSLGSFLLQLGRTDEAIRHFHAALRLQPDDAAIHNNLGGALLEKGNVAEAVHEFQEAVRLQPARFEGHRNLGHALLKQGRPDAAVREFQAALHLNPDSLAASNDLVTALGLVQKPATASPH